MLNHPFSDVLGDARDTARTRFYEIVSAANASESVKELANYCLDTLHQVLPFQLAFFLVWEQETMHLRVEESRRAPPLLARELNALQLPHDLLNAMAAENSAAALTPLLAQLHLVLAAHRVTGPHIAPLTAGSALLGLIVVVADTHPEVQRGWVTLASPQEFLDEVGAQVGVALKRFAVQAAVRHKQERRDRELRLFHELTLTLQDPLNLQAVLEKAVDIVTSVAHAPVVGMFVANDTQDGYTLAAYRTDLPTPRELLEQTGPELTPFAAEFSIESMTNWMAALPQLPRSLNAQQWKELGPDDLSNLQGAEFQTGFLIPLRYGEKVYGAILIGSRRPHALELNDVQRLDTLAAQLGLALYNRKIVADLRRQVHHVETAVRTGRLIQSTTNVKESLSRVARELRQALGASYIVLHVLRGDQFEYVTASDTRELGRTFPISSYEQKLMASSEPLAVQDRDAETVDPEQRAILSRLGMRASYGIRLYAQNRPIGLLFVNDEEMRSWQPHEARLIAAFAQQIAHALQNKLLLEESNQQVRELKALAHVGRLIAAANPPDRALYGCTDEIARVFGADYVSFHLREGSEMRLVAESHETGAPPTLPILPHQYRILEELDPVRVTDYRKDAAHPKQFEYLHAYSLVADLGVPLVAGQKALGILYISHHTPREWSDAQVQLAETFAQQVAGALTTSRLWRESQTQVRDLRALARSANLIARSRSPEYALPHAAEDLRSFLVADYVGFHLLEGDHFRIVTEAHQEHANQRYPLQPYHLLMLHHFQTMVIHDRDRDARDPVYRQTLVEWGYQADVAVPMVSRGRAIGVLFVSQKQPRRWQPGEVDLIQTYAQQIAIVVELVQLLAEKEARVRELAHLTDLQELTATILDEEVLTELALGGLQHLLNADRITLTMLRSGTPDVTHSSDGSEYPLQPTLRAADLEKLIGGKLPLIADPLHSEFLEDSLEDAIPGSPRSFLAVPMVAAFDTLGVLCFLYASERTFQEHEIRLAQTVANQIAVGFANTRLVYSQKERIQELNQLAQFSLWCGTVRDSRTLEVEATLRIHQLLGMRATSIRLVQGQMLSPGAGVGYKDRVARDQPLEISPRLHRILLQQEPYPIENLADDPSASTEWRTRHLEEGFHSLLMLPMIAEANVIGILSLFGAEPHRWNDHEIQYAQALANTVALALSNVRQMEMAERQSDELHTTLDSVFSGVFATDAEGVIRSWNRAAKEITGLSGAEMVGRAWHVVGPRFGAAGRPDEIVREAIAENKVQFGLAPRYFTRADGQLIQLRVAAAPLQDATGRVRGAVCSFWDRTAEQATERARIDFINLVGHQLNNKLGAMIWSAERLGNRNLSARSRKRLIEIITATRDELVPFNQRFNAFQQEHANEAVEVSQVELQELVRHKLDKWRATHADHHFRMIGSVPPVLGDKMRLDVVLDNLLENACKYSPRGSTITLRARAAKPDEVQLAIHNSGKPIPPALLPQLFDRWQRGDSKQAGSGLGLWLAQTKIHELGGEITVKSTAKRGTTFYVTLPRANYKAPGAPA